VDELRPEYDLKSLHVRLEPDVSEVFPDAESVNAALRFLIRIAREKDSSKQK